jgi:hypothetical protein
MNKKTLQSMLIVPTFEEEVSSIIKSLNSGSAGWDSVSMKILKSVQSAVIHPLTYVLNLSLSTGIFPRELKIARVIPLFKSGDISVLSNYRPVSVLPAVSKILEKLMFVRLLSFLKVHKILYDNQFGFRDGHSPNLALLLLVDKISCALERGDCVLGLFLDFSKAFDTVNHSILIKKLEYYGVRGLALKWFHSYLCDRSQFVEYNNAKSNNLYVSCGVPQGSILGPLLFLIYINDLPNISSKMFSIFFADDSNLFLSGKDHNELLSQMNMEITSVVEWLNVNKLSLNLKKTHFILFKPKKKKILLHNELVISGVKIARTSCTKFLGVYVDESLIWDHHLKYIKGKIARGLGIINKAKKYLNKSTLRTLYFSFSHPYFTFCVEVWGNTFACYLDPLVKLQKRIVRIIAGAGRIDHTAPLFKDMKIMNLEKIYKFAVLQFMYKFYHNELPVMFKAFFTYKKNIHSYMTRNVCFLHLPLTKSVSYSRTIKFTGVNLYNNYCDILDYNVSMSVFKNKLKGIL